MTILQRCAGLPIRRLATAEVLLAEGTALSEMYVVVEGVFAVSRSDQLVATVGEPGAVLGETSMLLQAPATATVVATTDAQVHVIEDPVAFVRDDPESLIEITRTLARRLEALGGYLSDVKAQYADSGGHLELMDEVLAELAYGVPDEIELGSDRDPEPPY